MTEKSVSSTKRSINHEGGFVDSKRNGKGRLILSDHSVYEGNFKDGKFDGYGEYKNKNFNYYGNFLSGKMHGQGKIEDLVKDSVYVGEFREDKKEGYGEEKYKDGSIYKGFWKNDLKDGKGFLIIQGNTNNFYDGEFKEDKLCGNGIYKWHDKKIYEGEWEDNEISGYGILLDGEVRHIGYFSHDHRDGYGSCFYIEQMFALLGKWEEDLIEGYAIVIPLPNGTIETDSYINNERIVELHKKEMIRDNLDEKSISEFKSSQEYQDMTQQYRNKFYPDFLRYLSKQSSNQL